MTSIADLLRSLLFFCLLTLLVSCGEQESFVNASVISFQGGDALHLSASYPDGKSLFLDKGLPQASSGSTLRYFNNTLYLVTASEGLYRWSENEHVWQELLGAEFYRRSYLEDVHEYRKITAFTVSADGRMAIAVKHALYESSDNGGSWSNITGSFNNTNYINSLAYANGALYVGTAHEGVYALKDGVYTSLSKGLYYEPYAGGALFYETVGFLKNVEGRLFCSQYFNKGLYELKGATWIKVDSGLSGSTVFYVEDLVLHGNVLVVSGEGALFEISDGAVHKKEVAGTSALPAGGGLVAAGTTDHPEFLSYTGGERPETGKGKYREADNKRALYTNIYYLKAASDTLIKNAKAARINAVVIDVKDDNGDIHLPLDFKAAEEIGAISSEIDLKPYIDKLHKEGLYLIARMVVFKDKRLFGAYGHKYAIWDKKYDRPWRAHNSEYWVDAHSRFVREYNIEAARLTALYGFDEIQFDYIRFPADGPLERCEYRYQKFDDMFKSEVLDDYLQEARSRIDVPLSVDIYGFTAFYNFGNRIGQDIEVFAKHVDAVSAMIYPSHYGWRFYMKGPREERPYRIVYDTSIRSAWLSGYKSYMRPYLQAFNLKSPTFGEGYILQQVRGVNEGHGNGYIFWHAGGRYSVVRRAFSDK